MVSFELILSTVIDFSFLLFISSIVIFFVYKLFSGIRRKIAEKYDLSWTKSVLVVNFVSVFLFLFLVFVYFYFLGGSMAKPIDPEIQYNIIDDLVVILFASVRIIVASLITTFLLLFFELTASFFMDMQIEKGKSKLFSEFFGIVITCAIALVLFLFIFNWAILGFFIYVFYGSIAPLPVLFINVL
jgi:hypothetical protein